ncbi:MAG TPA: 4-hydroxythreonine-4-phosphate dehydrogenase PdxA [Candidatus Omnitrophota bacterium]|jgi:4-hydroxythreonine-4-phosphate dehydrogenase|nr:4-hydroxythreonine-4-phosphate dehydrogenase PdxA [Candidatus Omnitrophota bacterium]
MMRKKKQTPCVIAITMGDPGGVGPEVIVKSLRRHKLKSSCRYVVIGSRRVFSFLEKKTGLSFPFATLPRDAEKLRGGKVYLRDMGGGTFDLAKESAANGRMAVGAIATAADLAGRGLVQAICTAPLNKASARLAQKNFVGHTEFFAARSGTKKFAMMFVGPRLKVTLATIHAPLKKVSGLLSAEKILEKIKLTAETLKRDFGLRKPGIAVCALNPHGRECGDEEDAVILPAVRRAVRAGIHAAGPFPADLLFHAAYEGKYDAVIGMYHDQALTAFKLVHFHDGVNVTLGLPYVRTSPDHGTAYDIAYRGKANPSSMTAALELAERLALNRNA